MESKELNQSSHQSDEKQISGYHRRIMDMQEEERPRERLMKYGAAALSDAELMAIIIGTGTQNQTAIDLSRSVLEAFNYDLSAFINAGVDELVRDPRLSGIGPGKACKIKAAIELGRRVHSYRKDKLSAAKPREVADYLIEKMQWYEQEHFVVLLLDSKLRIFSEEEIFVGTVNESLIHPREVFSPAIKQRAVFILAAHNHPSGHPEPSREDVEITNRLKTVGEIIGISLVDHIIVGEGQYFSFHESGLLEENKI